MPHHITLDHISYAHPGEPPLFTDISAVFSAPLTGLIGDNGTGKTTLFRLILSWNRAATPPTFTTPLATPGILKNAPLQSLPSTVLVLRSPRMPPTRTPFATF